MRRHEPHHSARERTTVSVGTAFHPRTSELNTKLEWREWAGYYAASVYSDHLDIEYNAIRESVALIDVSLDGSGSLLQVVPPQCPRPRREGRGGNRDPRGSRRAGPTLSSTDRRC